LTVDVATWSSIWDYEALASTAVDKGISMGTYTSTDSSFTTQLEDIVTAFGPARAGVGLETVNASTGSHISLKEVEWRFEQIAKSGAKEIDLWRMPVPPLWWPMIEAFMGSS
jgi:hypothetical protein